MSNPTTRESKDAFVGTVSQAQALLDEARRFLTRGDVDALASADALIAEAREALAA
jgi:hypothetical protein